MGKHRTQQEVNEILIRGRLTRGTSQTVKEFCRVNNIGRSSYYRWVAQRQDKQRMTSGNQVERELHQQINDRDLQISALRIAAEGN